MFSAIMNITSVICLSCDWYENNTIAQNVMQESKGISPSCLPTISLGVW